MTLMLSTLRFKCNDWHWFPTCNDVIYPIMQLQTIQSLSTSIQLSYWNCTLWGTLNVCLPTPITWTLSSAKLFECRNKYVPEKINFHKSAYCLLSLTDSTNFSSAWNSLRSSLQASGMYYFSLLRTLMKFKL